MIARLLAIVLAAGGSLAAMPPQDAAGAGDLDAFMARVLERRDENWRALGQYILEERETLRVTGPDGVPIYGFERQYAWFPREGFFVRSPLRADGVDISEEERRRAEDAYLRRQQAREADGTLQGRAAAAQEAPADAGHVLRQSFEPEFISSAYFLRFRFDPGRYALAGREQLLGRDALRIEYYPTRLFQEGRTRPNRRLRERDADITRKMNATSLVTLWIDPSLHQVLQYRFENVDLDFLPAAALVRIDGADASMRMAEAFPGVWLPAAVDVDLRLTLAIGDVAARYELRYENYRAATVTSRVTQPSPPQ